MHREIKLEEPWKSFLEEEFSMEYMQQLRSFLQAEKKLGKKIYPSGDLIFNGLNRTKFDNTKVVILGQDPYHGANQAHGLCFSVLPGVPVPPSLKNIYKELQSDLGLQTPNHGCLDHWAEQGVLLLNSVLTVEHSLAGSHQKKGWEQFTDHIISILNAKKSSLVFLLWGSYAQKKGAVIDEEKHLVLKSPHPSPFSAHRGFLGNKHFSKTNEYLTKHKIAPIDWQLPNI